MIYANTLIKNKYVMIDGERFFIVSFNKKNHVIPDKCPHRGGPLSLGQQCQDTGAILCPWHDNSIKPVLLLKRSIPAVRVIDTIFHL